jgi:hypothetical protein
VDVGRYQLFLPASKVDTVLHLWCRQMYFMFLGYYYHQLKTLKYIKIASEGKSLLKRKFQSPLTQKENVIGFY